jgi:hypothetical protein
MSKHTLPEALYCEKYVSRGILLFYFLMISAFFFELRRNMKPFSPVTKIAGGVWAISNAPLCLQWPGLEDVRLRLRRDSVLTFF